jgi:hypothetical protein
VIVGFAVVVVAVVDVASAAHDSGAVGKVVEEPLVEHVECAVAVAQTPVVCEQPGPNAPVAHETLHPMPMPGLIFGQVVAAAVMHGVIQYASAHEESPARAS